MTQTELAAQCTPPRPPNLHPFVMIVATPVGLWALYAWVPMKWDRDIVDLLLILAAGYLFVVHCADAYRRILDASDYSQRLAAYDRTCVCMRCGQRVLLPENWHAPGA